MVRMIEATNDIHNTLKKRHTIKETDISTMNNWIPANPQVENMSFTRKIRQPGIIPKNSTPLKVIDSIASDIQNITGIFNSPNKNNR
jgi:hypothetical protein